MDTRRTLTVTVWCAFAAAVYALIQYAGFDPVAWTGRVAYPDGAAAVLRPFGTLGNPVLLGVVLAPALGIITIRSLAGPLSPLLLAGALVLEVAALTTLSRGTWIAAGVAVMAAVAFGSRPGLRSRYVALIITGIIGVVIAAVWLRLPIISRITEDLRTESISTPARLEIARAAMAMWRLHPVLGTGPDTFGLVFPMVQTPAYWRSEWLSFPNHAHAMAFQILATLGLAGMLAAAVWMVGVVVASRAVLRDGAAGHVGGELAAGLAGLVAAGIFNIVGIAGATLFCVLSGLLSSLAKKATHPSSPPIGALAIIASMIGIGAAIPAIARMPGLRSAGVARSALEVSIMAPSSRAALIDIAVDRAVAATRTAGDDDEVWRLRCDALLAQATVRVGGDSTGAMRSAIEAETAARRALLLEPHRATNLQRLANAFASRALLSNHLPDRQLLWARADSIYQLAERSAPTDALILVDQSRALLQAGNASAALRVAGRITALYPRAAMGHALTAAAYLQLGDLPGARTALHRALRARWDEADEAQRQTAATYARSLDSLRSPK